MHIPFEKKYFVRSIINDLIKRVLYLLRLILILFFLDMNLKLFFN